MTGITVKVFLEVTLRYGFKHVVDVVNRFRIFAISYQMAPRTPDHEFENLFKTNYVRLYRCALSLVADSHAAKDIVQEVFLKCWKNRDRLPATESQLAYLTTAVTRTSLNHLRNRKLKMGVKESDVVGRGADDELEYREFARQVDAAIARLPEQCRTIFQLSRQEGLTYQQIADMLSLSVKTVENQMGIALQKLRQSLKPFVTLNSFVWPLLTAGSYFAVNCLFPFGGIEGGCVL